MAKTRIRVLDGLLALGLLVLTTAATTAGESGQAFKVYDRVVSMDDLTKENQASFYDLEKKKYDQIQMHAKEAYLNEFWSRKAKEQKISINEAQKRFLDQNVQVSPSEVAEIIKKYGDQPELAKKSKKEQEETITNYLRSQKAQGVMEDLVASGMRKGELSVLYPEPAEPIYSLSVTDKDHVRYGPTGATEPTACKGDACPITVIEYSEFQCPFCEKVLPSTQKLLQDYKGKIRWIVRDYPLPFHDRAQPAAIAAKCASFQGKYWEMYTKLFDNQSKLGDQDLRKYATDLKLDMKKYDECTSKPDQANAMIEVNKGTASGVGVNGTPAFFINGRKLSGALPYSEFAKVIDDELAKKGAKKTAK